MSDIRDTLNIRVESPFWDEAYAKALLDEEIPTWLTPEFINMLHEDYGVLQRTYDVVISALPKVLAVRELCLLAKTVYHILDKRLPYSKSFKSLELPSVPDTDENTLGYRCVLVFPVLMHVHKTWCELIKRYPEANDLESALVTRENVLKQLLEKGNYTNKYIKKTVYANEGYKNLPLTSPGYEAN